MVDPLGVSSYLMRGLNNYGSSFAGPTGIVRQIASSYQLADNDFSDITRTALRMAPVFIAPNTELKKRVVDSLDTTIKGLFEELNQPPTADRKARKFTITLPFSFSFRFPMRLDETEDWKPKDMLMLGGTKATYTISYGKKDRGIVTRTISLEFGGATKFHNGFWGPIVIPRNGDTVTNPFPEYRIDKITFTEYFDANGKALDYNDIVDYQGNEKKIPYKVSFLLSRHNAENGSLNGCIPGTGFFARFSDVEASCATNRGGESVMDVNYSKQLDSIFENIGKIKIYDTATGNILTQGADEFKKCMGKVFPNSEKGEAKDMVLMMWFSWRVGVRDVYGEGSIDKVIEAVEDKVKSKK